jgi:hypothetical protein
MAQGNVSIVDEVIDRDAGIFSSPQHLERLVDGDPGQPRRKLAIPAKGPNVLVDLKEGILDGVLRIFVASGYSERKTLEATVVAVHKRTERLR